MSRIGAKHIQIPENVTLDIVHNQINVNGAKGNLSVTIPRSIKIAVENDEIIVTRSNNNNQTRANHGLVRSLVNNAVIGVSQGFEKKLNLVGIGYKAILKENILELNVGFSHPVNITAPEGIIFKVEKNAISVSGIDKQLVGQVAANIRSVKKPEPYKGKGIKYSDEIIIKKAGKTAKAGE